MTTSTATRLVPTPLIVKVSAGDPFVERVPEIRDLIARRAYELFESSGFTQGHDVADWLQAESEILQPVPFGITEKEAELIVRVDVRGFEEKDLEVRVEPRRLFIAGQLRQVSETKEWSSKQIFPVVELPVEIEPHRAQAALGRGVLEVTLPRLVRAGSLPRKSKAAAPQAHL